MEAGEGGGDFFAGEGWEHEEGPAGLEGEAAGPGGWALGLGRVEGADAGTVVGGECAVDAGVLEVHDGGDLFGGAGAPRCGAGVFEAGHVAEFVEDDGAPVEDGFEAELGEGVGVAVEEHVDFVDGFLAGEAEDAASLAREVGPGDDVFAVGAGLEDGGAAFGDACVGEGEA